MQELFAALLPIHVDNLPNGLGERRKAFVAAPGSLRDVLTRAESSEQVGDRVIWASMLRLSGHRAWLAGLDNDMQGPCEHPSRYRVVEPGVGTSSRVQEAMSDDDKHRNCCQERKIDLMTCSFWAD